MKSFLVSSVLTIAAVASLSAAPEITAPAAYRDAENLGSWKTAAPADNEVRSAWWKLFDDSTLDELETHALAANQDLQAAAARVEQAAAAAGIARSAYWPQ